MGSAMSIKAKGIRPVTQDGRLLEAPERAIDPFNPRGLTFADLDEVARLEIPAIPERVAACRGSLRARTSLIAPI